MPKYYNLMMHKIPSCIIFEANAFKDAMKEVRKKGKSIIKGMSQQAVDDLSAKLKKDLSNHYVVQSLDMKLGNFRGIFYVTSCKMTVKPKGLEFKDEEDTKPLLDYLKDNYNPKFKLKSISNGEAYFNVR